MVKVVGSFNGSEVLYMEELFRLNELFVIETSNRSLFPQNFICFQFNGVKCTSQRLAQAFLHLSSGMAGPLGLSNSSVLGNNSNNNSNSNSSGTAPGLIAFVIDWDDDTRYTAPSNSTVATKTQEEIAVRCAKTSSFAIASSSYDLTTTNSDSCDQVSNSTCPIILRHSAARHLEAQLSTERVSTGNETRQNRYQLAENASAKLSRLISVTESIARQIRSLQQQSEDKQRHYVQLKFFVESRQQKLFRDVLVVYPITQGKSGEYSIRGIELPYDLSAVKDDESLASALGYLVHVLLMLSKYWEVPLRYQLLYHGSRCLVRDLAASSTATIYPLFRHYNDKDRFEKGISWLRVDLEQLLQTRGLIFDNGRSLLANLVQLQQACDICPSLAY
jgi:hypothetical protein